MGRSLGKLIPVLCPGAEKLRELVHKENWQGFLLAGEGRYQRRGGGWPAMPCPLLVVEGQVMTIVYRKRRIILGGSQTLIEFLCCHPAG